MSLNCLNIPTRFTMIMEASAVCKKQEKTKQNAKKLLRYQAARQEAESSAWWALPTWGSGSKTKPMATTTSSTTRDDSSPAIWTNTTETSTSRLSPIIIGYSKLRIHCSNQNSDCSVYPPGCVYRCSFTWVFPPVLSCTRLLDMEQVMAKVWKKELMKLHKPRAISSWNEDVLLQMNFEKTQ